MVTLPLTVLSIGIGGVGAVSIIQGVRGGSVRSLASVLRRGSVASAAAALAGSVIVLAMAAVGPLRMFGVMHYVYLVVTVSFPMVGVASGVAVWRTRKDRGSGFGSTLVPWLLVVFLVLPGPIGFYATHVEPTWLRVDHVDVVLDPARAGDDPVTIGVLADLQTNRVGDHEYAAIDALMTAEPDMILIPGDLFHGDDHEYERELDAMRDLLGELHAPHGVYFAQGDADPEQWVSKMLEGTDVEVLNRDVVDLEIGDRRLRIGGHTLHPSGYDAEVVRNDLNATTDPGVITVLLGHRPDTVLYLPGDARVDLTVAGHTHGGQIVLPGFGPLVTLSEVPRDVARGGLHRVDGNQIYVSPGVGMERGDAPQVRLFNRPAVAILTLR